MSDSDLFISVSVISMSEYEIVINTEFDIIINRYWEFFNMSCPGAAFFLSLHFLSSAPLLCNAQGSFCRDYPVRYVFCIEYIDRIVMRLYPFRAHFC